MKNTYSATIKMTSAEQLAKFIDEIGPLVESVIITTTPVVKPVAKEQSIGDHTMSPYKTKTPGKARTSKVNDTIMQTLRSGNATVRELKEALERNGLSPGSLSTGIATLQREGAIERIAEGTYALTGMQAAAE